MTSCDNRALCQAARNGDKELVMSLIVQLRNDTKDQPYVINGYILDECENGNSPLKVSARNGHLDVVVYLLENIFLYHHEDMVMEYQSNRTLFCGAEHGNKEVMICLIQKHVQGYINENHNITAAFFKNKNILSSLVQNQIQQYINLKDPNGKTTLHHAALRNNVDTLDYLLSIGGEWYTKDCDDKTPLHYAAEQGNTEAVNSLITHIRKYNRNKLYDYINDKDDCGYTALSLAVENIDIDTDLVKCLINNGAEHNATIRDEFGMTPLQRATYYGLFDVVVALIDDVRTNNPDFLKDYVNIKDGDGDTAIYRAIEIPDMNLLPYLLNNGADHNAKNNNKMTPLHYAAQWGHIDTVIDLVTHARLNNSSALKHYINDKDIDGNTAFQYASMNNNDEIVKYLLNNGAQDNS